MSACLQSRCNRADICLLCLIFDPLYILGDGSLFFVSNIYSISNTSSTTILRFLYHYHFHFHFPHIQNIQKRPIASRPQIIVKPQQPQQTPKKPPIINVQAASYTANKPPTGIGSSTFDVKHNQNVDTVQPVTLLEKQCQPYEIKLSVDLYDKQEMYSASEDLCRPCEDPVSLKDQQEVYPTSKPYNSGQPIDHDDRQEIIADPNPPCNNGYEDADYSTDEFMSATQAIAWQDKWGVLDKKTKANASEIDGPASDFCPKPLVLPTTCLDSSPGGDGSNRKAVKRSGSVQSEQWGFKVPSGTAPTARKSTSPTQTPSGKPRLSPQMLGTKITPPLCSCGRRSKKNNVVAPGPNQGRGFYSCPNRRSGRTSECALQDSSNRRKTGCGYFKWESAVLRDRVVMSSKPVNYKYTPVSGSSTPCTKSGTPGTVGKLGQSFLSVGVSNRLEVNRRTPIVGSRRLGISQHTGSPMTFKLSM